MFELPSTTGKLTLQYFASTYMATNWLKMLDGRPDVGFKYRPYFHCCMKNSWRFFLKAAIIYIIKCTSITF